LRLIGRYMHWVRLHRDSTWTLDSLEHYWTVFRRRIDSTYTPGDRCDSLFARFIARLRSRRDTTDDDGRFFYSGVSDSKLKPEFSVTAYPNPFNSAVNVSLYLPETSPVVAEVYDIRGEKVYTLANSTLAAGTYQLTWRPENAPAGMYIIKVRTDFGETTRVVHYAK